MYSSSLSSGTNGHSLHSQHRHQQHQHHQHHHQHHPSQKDPVTVVAVPSVSIHENRLIVGDAKSSSTRSYTPLKVLGDGSFGTVWLCDWHGTLPPNTPLSPMQCGAGARPEWTGKRLVAVKRMKKKWEGGWNECKKLKELESLRAIPFHPNIIPLYDFFLLPASKELYFVFESMEGNLYHLIKARKGRHLAGGLVSSIFRQVVSGLDHIHTSGYFHRDMKPENVLVTTTGLFDYPSVSPIAPPGAPPERDVVAIIKLADFGLARETKSAPPYTEYVSTRWYRAPEVLLLSRDYSNPVDMWALGTIMAELVNLRPLFPGSGQIDQVARICQILGDPCDEYGTDARGKPIGGGKWSRGTKMAKVVGFAFPKTRPIDINSLFERTVPHSLIDCITDLLRYDPQMRLTSRQCLEHQYVRETSTRSQPPPPAPPQSAPTVKSQQRNPAWPVTPLTIPSHPHPTPSPHPNTPASADCLHPPLMPAASSSHRTPFYSGSGASTSPHPSPVPKHHLNSVTHQHSAWDDLDGIPSTDGDWDHPMDQSDEPVRVSRQPMDIQTSPMAQEFPARPHVEPDTMHERTNVVDARDIAQPQGTKLGKFGALAFAKKPSKWGLGMFGHGDKSQPHALPPVDEMPVAPSSSSTPSLKRTQSSSSDSRSLSDLSPTVEPPPRPLDAKKLKKEAERVHREAEKQRRALAAKTQREQARAVMQKRNQMMLSTDELEWKWQNSGRLLANGHPRTNMHETRPNGKKAASGPIRQNQGATTNGMSCTTVNAASGKFAMQVESPPGEWRRDNERVAKARKREFDDDHSMSSSDMHSLSQLSSISFATVDSDPGPRQRPRPSLFTLSRMTSTSSLRTSFDEFSPSARSSNSFSLEQQLANDFHNHASMDPSSPLSDGASPPPMQLLSLSPSLSPTPSWIQHINDNNCPPSRRHQHPNFISKSPPIPQHPSNMNPSGPPSPYEFGGQLPTMSPTSFGHPPSPGYAPKSAINPIFKVPPLPSSNGDRLSSPTSLPPFSHLEAVAEGEYPALSAMTFSLPDDS